MHFVIFSGGDFTPSSLSTKILKEADSVIAADSGADTAIHCGIYPSIVVGDMDSISKQARELLLNKGTKFIDMPTTLVSLPKGNTKPLNASEKDQTDTELAIEYAVTHGAKRVTVLGGIEGDRFDHIMANILLATVCPIPITYLSDTQIMWTAKGPTQEVIQGEKGDTISLIPLSKTVEHITTKNLYYPLQNGTLFFGKPRGLSNVFTEDTVTVSFNEGLLFFVHTTHVAEE